MAAAEAAGAERGARVFPYSEHKFRSLFASAAADLGIPSDITPHSLRHGGATHDYASHRLTTDQIRVRGRWKSEKSMHHYVGAMRSALVNRHIPEDAVRCGAAIAPCLLACFTHGLEAAPYSAQVVTFRRTVQRTAALRPPAALTARPETEVD